jgi:pimeloyl-ACP methyl ester carboxylesterase/protein-tyrosine phosphatase
LRIFFREHPQFAKLPVDPAPLPLLVFIHGLGGSVAQFDPLLTSLVNVASSLAIDLPGCGLSAFEESAWDAYTIENLAELLSVIISEHRVARQGVVLVGHSLGCSLAALIASRASPLPNSVAEHVIGIVAICPRAEPPTEKEVAMFTKLLWVPSPIFDLWRRWDRRGGKDSASVQRFVGPDADETTKLLQYRFNDQSKTPVWRRMASGTLPKYDKGVAKGGLPGKEIWATLHIPIFLAAGEDDNVTKPENIDKIASFLGKGPSVQDGTVEGQPIVDAAAPVNLGLSAKPAQKRTISSIRAEDFLVHDEATTENPHDDLSTPDDTITVTPPQHFSPKKTLKTTMLPKPASHAMLYQPASVRILAGLIFDFLSKQISPRLDLGWQLQYLSSSGKWDVKNLEKWKAVRPVSEPINNIFRAMKTLREVDPTHSPLAFCKDWENEIKDIVDISHEAPVYDPRNLSKNGITYHKFPTVSKIPPTEPEVAEFIRVIDDIRASQPARKVSENWGDEIYIGVHCHYGFNRTGFFIVCYLTERCGYSVDRAIEEFKVKRPKGIKHTHFLDELFVRYCRGLKRTPTF